MVREEDFAQGVGHRQEGQPLLREDIVRADVEPGLGSGLFLVGARLRQFAEHAGFERRHFVVVVEDHAAVARDAEVLQQQVAGEDVRGGQVAQRVAVVHDRGLGGGRLGLAQEQVQRSQAPLDVAVLDHQVVALGAAALAGLAQQLFGELRHEARARQAQAPEFLRVDQAPGAVVAEHEAVAVHDLLARRVLGCPEGVADHLEHEVMRGQREDDHHQALLARSAHEGVDGAVEMAPQREVALGLALLGATEHGVEFVDRLVRHERAQQRDRRPDHRQVDVEVGVGVAELSADLVAREQHVLHFGAGGAAAEHHDQRRERAVADQPADQQGLVAAVEDRLDQLDGCRGGAGRACVEVALEFGGHAARRLLGRGQHGGEGQFGQHFGHRRAQ